MRKYLFFIMLFTISCFPANVFSQVISAEPRNKIDIVVMAEVQSVDNNLYRYIYTIVSKPTSQQKVWMFEVLPFDKKGIDQKAPSGWSTASDKGFPPVTGWDAAEGSEINPGATLNGFIFVTTSLPVIITFYAEGWAPIPEIEWEFEGPIHGYDDLTPYGPGVIGKTIGPVEPPAIFNPLSFLNHIINLKKEAFKLGWITNKGIEQSLDAKLENAKKKLETGDIKNAKNILNAFLNEVEAQKDKHLTSEAYGLLKYNTQYIVERL